MTDEQQEIAQLRSRVRDLEHLEVFLAGIAHDFNNILVGIQGNAELALLGEGNVEERLEDIKSASTRASQLAGQLLKIAGKGGVEEIELGAMVSDLVRELSKRLKQNISCIHSGDPVYTSLKRDRLMGLLAHVCLTTEGSVGITTGTKLLDDNAAKLCCCGGPAPGQFAFIEFKIPNSSKDKISQSYLVELLKSEGGGLQRADRSSGFALTALLPVVKHSDKQPTEGLVIKPAKVLLVDDEDMVLKVFSKMLERLNQKVSIARDGLEAISVYQAHSFDYVLLDLSMPVMDGQECFMKLKKINPEVKVLISSGYNHVAVDENVLKGASGFIQKPCSMTVLAETLRKIVV